jgi:hypothetical protein
MGRGAETIIKLEEVENTNLGRRGAVILQLSARKRGGYSYQCVRGVEGDNGRVTVIS